MKTTTNKVIEFIQHGDGEVTLLSYPMRSTFLALVLLKAYKDTWTKKRGTTFPAGVYQLRYRLNPFISVSQFQVWHKN